MADYTFGREVVDGLYNIDNPARVDELGNPIHLAREVEDALPGKTFTLDCAGDVATFSFEAELTGAEYATLAATVARHKTNA